MSVEVNKTGDTPTAEAYLANGEIDTAIATCEQILKENPNAASAHLTLGKALQAKGELESAMRSYSQVIYLQPNITQAHLRLASAYAEQQQWQQALMGYQTALKLDPDLDVASVWQPLAEIYEQMGNPDKAIECWEKAIAHYPEQVTPQDYLKLGNRLRNKRQCERALAVFEQSLKQHSRHAALHYGCGKVYEQQEQWQAAIECYQNAIARHDKKPEYHFDLGNTLSQMGRWTEALASYEQAIERQSDNELYYRTLGNALQKLGNFEQAKFAYDRAIELAPNSHLSYHGLADTLRKQRKLTEAIAAYIQAIELQPSFSLSYCYLGDTFVLQNRDEDAIAAYLQNLNCQIDQPFVWDRLGRILTRDTQSDLEAGIERYCLMLVTRSASNTLPVWQQFPKCDRAEFYGQLADRLNRRGQHTGAVILYRMALVLAPADAKLTEGLNKALLKHIKLQAQIASYRQQIVANPQSAGVQVQLGNLLANQGYIEEAKIYHRRVFELAQWEEALAHQYEFTSNWLTNNLPNWQEHLQPWIGQPNVQALEIGSYQGMSACWLLDRVLTHPSATIACVDPYFQDEFYFNLDKTGAGDRVIKLPGKSVNVLRSLAPQTYDLIYIDGSHLAVDAFLDALLSWQLLKVGGLLMFDDYKFIDVNNPFENTQVGIDSFIELFAGQVEIVHQQYQLFLKKVAEKPEAELNRIRHHFDRQFNNSLHLKNAIASYQLYR
jgi:tetratricopeptide (TPR) repeat protein